MRVTRRAIFDGLYSLRELNTGDFSSLKDSTFSLLECENEIVFDNSRFDLKELDHLRLQGRLIISFFGMSLRDKFRKELKATKAEEMARLERACRFIARRHREDGLQSLEYQFGRFALAAAARDSDYSLFKRVPLFLYEWSSGYGESILKPFFAFIMTWAFFFILYGAILSVELSRNINFSLPIDPLFISDLMMLVADKSFPFAISNDTSLFESVPESPVLGAGSGVVGAAIAVLGVLQSLIGTVFVFLIGLGIRNRLAIR